MNAPIHDLHLSNLLTYASLAASLAAIAVTRSNTGLPLAGALIAIAVLSDTFDGKFARLFHRTDREARVGGQIDSLVDAIAFGLTPVVVLTALPDRATGALAFWWWGAAFLYVLAAVTRLCFYNINGDDDGFVGIPMPAAALILCSAIVFNPSAGLVAALFVGCAAAMTAPLPIPRPRGVALWAFALWALGLIAKHLHDLKKLL